MEAKSFTFNTLSGVEVICRETEIPLEDALGQVYQSINHSKGAVFSSGFDYPGRHSRWDIGFVNPALEFVSAGSKFWLNALNPQGQVLLKIIFPKLRENSHVTNVCQSEECVSGGIAPFPEFFLEEQRSRLPSTFSVLRTINEIFSTPDASASHFGFYGAFGYDLVLQFEKLKLKHTRQSELVDCHLFLPLELTVVDRKREKASSINYSVKFSSTHTSELPNGGQSYSPAEASGPEQILCDHQEGEFAEKVKKVIEGTKLGNYFEVILSQTFSSRFGGKPTELFQQLARVNPSPYMFLINLGTEQLVGASPEIYVRVTGKRYETCPISGTVPRGKSALEDADQVLELLNSEKEASELTMCTDVDRNDMARVCLPGSVKILGRRQLEFYSHLIHTVDHLEGTLRDEFDALDAFQTHMWACTVTGAPKPAALQEIENLENSPRGWYSGAIGFLSFQGDLNTGITLRTAHLKDGRAILRSGATLLFGSDPEGEERETRTKAAAFLTAIANYKNSQLPQKQPQQEIGTALKVKSAKKILLVDCNDSFVHNLASYIRALGCAVDTVRCGFPLEILQDLKPDLVLLSPGPGTPSEFGIPSLVGKLIERQIPMFGVCLGHQGIGQHFGATLGQLPTPVHGKTSKVTHQSSPLFEGVPAEFEAGRYHSLYLLNDSVPKELKVTSYTIRKDNSGAKEKSEIIPMSFEHTKLPIASVQFHPESLMTLKDSSGYLILRNAINNLTN